MNDTEPNKRNLIALVTEAICTFLLTTALFSLVIWGCLWILQGQFSIIPSLHFREVWAIFVIWKLINVK